MVKPMSAEIAETLVEKFIPIHRAESMDQGSGTEFCKQSDASHIAHK